jgi:sn-glycerol 3-phosphate transport system permease protein
MAKHQIFSYFSRAVKILIGLMVVFPLLLGVSYSFMSPAEMSSIPPHILPRNPVINTYLTVVRVFPIFRFMINSFVVCAIIIFGQILTCSLSAYAYSFYSFKGRRLLFMMMLFTLMIPADAVIIANYLSISRLHLNDTYAGLVLPFLTSAMGIFLMRQFFLTIPKELHEAAILDGCRDLRFLFEIVLPVSKPAITSLGLYTFINIYNQFFWPLLVTNSNRMRTVQVGIMMLRGNEGENYPVIMAGAVMVLLPSVIVFIIGQKNLVKGMIAGAVKG